jgi:hypothetical protein
MLIQGGRRILAKPVQKKEPITIDILKSIHDFYRLSENKSDLNSVRLFCMLIVGYSGFLRFNEIFNFKVNDVKFCDLYMQLCIQSSKTDVYMQERRRCDYCISWGFIESRFLDEALNYQAQKNIFLGQLECSNLQINTSFVSKTGPYLIQAH